MPDHPLPLLYVRIGQNLRDAREQRGITQHDLATASGLSRSSIANTEHGRQRITIHALVALAQALDMGPADLLGNDVPRFVDPAAASVDRLRQRLEAARVELAAVIAGLAEVAP